jgi:C4-dicarboxylate-specific signal transduction histidine kinase
MKSPLHILHLEDSPEDAELIRDILETDGIVSHVTRVETQADFLTSLEQGRFDLILADYSLPSFDGLSALKLALEKSPNVPFVFVSATLGEEVAIEALKLGATDYVLKDRLSRIASSVQRALREAEERNQRKRAEEELRDAQIELAHVTRVATLGELAASIAHELNQPLGAVVNNASACLRWLAANNVEEARHSAELIRADGHRAGEIIARIRALAKKTPQQKDWIDINQAIREVIALARSEVERNGVALETQLSHDVQHVPLVFADRIQLQQVILNLMMNAIEAMSEVSDGPRQLLIRSAADESQNLVVTVQDSGPGLAPENLDRLFTPFYTTKPQGMGMGLAICRSIVEAHGGRLWATANDDRGAVFQFTLPRGDERAA